MSIALKTKLTPEEYLAIERDAEYRSEFYRGEMFAMAGGTEEHNLIVGNLRAELRAAFKTRSCRAYSENLRLRIPATGLYTYPDVMALCGEPEFSDETHDMLLNPQFIAEVLSDKTEAYDRGQKFAHYRSISSFSEYVLVSQTQPLVECFTGQADGSWKLVVFAGLDAIARFESIAAAIPLAEIYRDVVFPPAMQTPA
jgi:Uma2 family endonuclease